MKLSILQVTLQWADTRANLEHAAEMMLAHQGEDIDVFVLPEMFSTGFVMNPQGVADADGTVLAWMQAMAARMDAAIVGSVAVEDDGHFYNRAFFVRPDGTYDYADKRHLFTYGGENRYYTRGDRRVIIPWRGTRFLLLVCYDLRFPIWSRCRDDYDAIIYVANWPVVRQRSWDILLPARAMENQSFVIGANRVGQDPMCEYQGGSIIYDFYGQPLATAQPYEEGAITAQLDMAQLKHFRTKFPVLDDHD